MLGRRRGYPATPMKPSNLVLTMVIVGLWHGAAWTFVIWGGLHGLFLCANHGWKRWGRPLPMVAAWLVTFVVVMITWVFFRATTVSKALVMMDAMLLSWNMDFVHDEWPGRATAFVPYIVAAALIAAAPATDSGCPGGIVDPVGLQ